MGASSQEMLISGLRERHQKELDNLTLKIHPVKTLKFFILAIVQYLKRWALYLLTKGGWLLLLSSIFTAFGVLLMTIDGPHEKHVEELLQYFQFAMWWIALGVASSIGLGSGLHTFVLYLGPHIAFFTIKAMQCGRVDLKTAPYDTIQLKRGPSWLDKECSEFGPALFTSSDGLRVPLSSILPQVQVEAMLWGLGTALGELPPYFISRAASTSGSNMVELDDPSLEESGVLGTHINKIMRWFLTNSRLNFFTVLVLASVPNPLFDLAGIMCGQFGVPFWEFFLATMIGKAVIKTHIQTVFIISVCNNQLLHWIENELIWVLSHIPGLASVMPTIVAKLHIMRDKYMNASSHVPTNVKVSGWDFSFATIWNAFIWIVLVKFFIEIVNATAKTFLKKQLDKELAAVMNSHQTPDIKKTE